MIILVKIKWLIDFNDMSIYLGLFYAKRLRNCVICIFINTFFVELSLIGIILRWGFLIWEFFYLFIYCGHFFFSGPVVQWIETLSLYHSWWALSEDSGFKSYPSRPEVYLVKKWCDRQQLWKAVITGDTVTRLSIPIRGRGKSPEEGQRWNLAETLWKKKQHKN